MPPGAKRRSPWVWVAVGCGAILLICAIAFVVLGWWATHKLKGVAEDWQKNPAKAAEFMIKMNPDLEVVSTDDAKGTLTIRDKKTNKTVTVNLEQIKNGKIEFEADGQKATFGGDQNGMTVTGPDGKATVGTGASAERPSWVPVYPGSTDPQSLMSVSNDQEKSGSFSFTTSDTAQKVSDYYKEQLTTAGLKVEGQGSFGSGASGVGFLSAKSADDGRKVSVTLSPGDNGGTSALIAYTEKVGS
jgi:hypothetical protein